MCPVVSLAVSLAGLLSPATTSLLSQLQDLIAAAGILLFTQHTVALVGPLTSLPAQSCPLATPPLCCLACCPAPALSPCLATAILTPIRLLPAILVTYTTTNMFLVYSGNAPASLDYSAPSLSGLHSLLLVPFFLSAMYCFKVFISLTSPVMAGTNPKLRGILLFLQFGLCKAVRVVFTILANLRTFPCLPGVSASSLASLCSTAVQLVLLAALAATVPRLYSAPWTGQPRPLPRLANREEEEEAAKL